MCILDSHHSGQYNSDTFSLRPAISTPFLHSSQRTIFIPAIEPTVEPRAHGSVRCYWKVGWQGHLHRGGIRLLEMRWSKYRTSHSYRDSAGWCRRDVWLPGWLLSSVKYTNPREERGGRGEGANKSIVALSWPRYFPSSYNRTFQSPSLVAISVT